MHRDEFRRIFLENMQQQMAERNNGAPLTPEQEALALSTADSVFAGLESLLDEQSDLSAAATAAAVAATRQAGGHAAPAGYGTMPVGGAPATVPTAAASGSYAAAEAAQSVPPAQSRDEVLLWRGRPYLTIGTIYELTSQRLRVIRGIVSNVIEEVELVRVRDTAVSQSVGERMFDIGDITVYSSDSTTPEKILFNVRNPVEVREMIRKAVYEERERRKLLYREDMGGESAMDYEPNS